MYTIAILIVRLRYDRYALVRKIRAGQQIRENA